MNSVIYNHWQFGQKKSSSSSVSHSCCKMQSWWTHSLQFPIHCIQISLDLLFPYSPPQKTQNHSFSLGAGPFRAFFAGLLKRFLGFNFSFRFASAEASASLSGVSVRTAQCRFFFPLDLAFLGGAAGRGAKDSGLKSEDVETTGAIEEAGKLSTEPIAVAKVDVNERTQEFTKAAARLLTWAGVKVGMVLATVIARVVVKEEVAAVVGSIPKVEPK